MNTALPALGVGSWAPSTPVSAFCVFDGHNGRLAAEICAHRMLPVLMEELASLGAEGAGDAADAGAGAGWPPQARIAARVRAVCVFFLGLDAPLCVLHPSHPPYHGQMDAALKSTFQKLDQHIRSLMARPPPQRAPPTSPLSVPLPNKKNAQDDGCTATVVLVLRRADGQLSVKSAWVGDSTACLALYNCRANPGEARVGVPTQPATLPRGARRSLPAEEPACAPTRAKTRAQGNTRVYPLTVDHTGSVPSERERIESFYENLEAKRSAREASRGGGSGSGGGGGRRRSAEEAAQRVDGVRAASASWQPAADLPVAAANA